MDPAQILSNGGVRMDFGGICVLYFIWNVEAKGSWVGGVGTVRHNVRHFAWLQKTDLLGYGFSLVRLDGWRHLDTQNYREVHGGVYKKESKQTRHNSYFQPVALGILAFGEFLLSIWVPATGAPKFLWKFMS